MSWETVSPLANPKAAPMVSASVRKLKSGQVKLHLFFSTFLIEEMGGGSGIEVQAGSGENAGKLRLVFGGEGPFAVKDVMRFARLEMPAVGGAPERNTVNARCEILHKDAAARELIIALPLAAWAIPAAPDRKAPAPAMAVAAGAAATGSPCPARPLNAIEYLRLKAHKVEPLAAGKLQVDGEAMTKGQVLNLINGHRQRAGLEPLNHASVAYE